MMCNIWSLYRNLYFPGTQKKKSGKLENLDRLPMVE